MKTLQEKYNAILEGNFSKAQFVRDARMELPNLITQFNGFKDTTAILKNRGMIFEAKKEKTKEYDQPTPGYSIEALERAVDYEIEGMGLQSQETISEKDYLKAKTKAEKNLDKNPNHYLNLISGESNKVDKHDKYVEVKKNNHVDTFNGMKKAELKESIVEKAMAKGYTKEQVEAALSRLKEKKGTDHDGDRDIDSDDYMAAKDKAIKKSMGKKVNEADYDFKEGDKVSVFMRGTKADGPEEVTIVAMDPSGVALVKNAEGISDEVYIKDIHPSQGVEEIGMFHDPRISSGNFDHLTSNKEEEQLKKAYAALDKAEQDGDIRKQELALAAIDLIKGKLNEGRRKKTQGGKIVTENDYETGGYVESMGPMFDKAVSGLIAAFTEWKEGPMTEPGMIPHAKKDVVQYIDGQLEQSLAEEVEESIEEAGDKVAQEQIKEAIKGIITNILKEEVITEAATGNLANIADTYNDFEGMQSAINALENIVTDVESYYAKTKEKIQKVYDSFNNIKNPEGIVMGALIGPAIESAFKKDLIPVASKGFTEGLKLPQVKMLKPGDVQEEELEEKATVFTPINETRKRKYTKSKK